MTVERRQHGARPEWTPLGQIADSIADAKAAEPGSDEARGHATRALFELMQEIAPVLDRRIRAPLDADAPPETQRLQMLEVLRLLNDAMLFPSLNSLAVDLEELSRGITSPRLEGKPGGQRGGLSNTDELQVMREIVDAANAIKRLSRNNIEYEAQLGELGSPYSTVNDYRRKLAQGPADYRKPRSYALTYGQQAPADLIRESTRRLAAVRRAKAEHREKTGKSRRA